MSVYIEDFKTVDTISYVLSGGFDPITDAHAELISSLPHKVYIIVNSDQWLEKKKGAFLMPLEVRMRILKSLRNVKGVFPAVDTGDGTVTETLRLLATIKDNENLIFINSGDRKPDNTPEFNALDGVFKNLRFEWIESRYPSSHSSIYLDNWVEKLGYSKIHRSEINNDPLYCKRPWGHWTIITENPTSRSKLLVVNPGNELSLQRHKNRKEYWRVLSGNAGFRDEPNKEYLPIHEITIKAEQWHQLKNLSHSVLIVHEVQTSPIWGGCEEMDIERYSEEKGYIYKKNAALV